MSTAEERRDIHDAAERHVAKMLSAYLMTDLAYQAANDVVARLVLSGFDIVRRGTATPSPDRETAGHDEDAAAERFAANVEHDADVFAAGYQQGRREADRETAGQAGGLPSKDALASAIQAAYDHHDDHRKRYPGHSGACQDDWPDAERLARLVRATLAARLSAESGPSREDGG